MTYEEFRNLAQGIQAILVALALLIAGGWAIYRFRSLLSVQKANADLAKTNAELEKSKAELHKLRRDLEDRPYIKMDIAPYLVGIAESEGLYLRIKLTLANSGRKRAVVDWTQSTVCCARVNGWSNDQPELGEKTLGHIGRINTTLLAAHLWPNESTVEEALVPIAQHGLYLVYTRIIAFQSTSGMVGEQLEMASLGAEADRITFATVTHFDTRAAPAIECDANSNAVEDA